MPTPLVAHLQFLQAHIAKQKNSKRATKPTHKDKKNELKEIEKIKHEPVTMYIVYGGSSAKYEHFNNK